MAKAKKTPVANATASVFPTEQEIHAATQAALNAPPKGVNWEGFDTELSEAFRLQGEADESLRTLAGKMFVCGFRFAMLNNDKGEAADTPASVELRKRITRRLSDREQALVNMDRFNAATLTTVEKAVRKLAKGRVNDMMSLIRKHLKKVEEINSGRGSTTLEKKLYDKCTEILDTINKADPDKAKFDIGETRDLIIELRKHFDI